MSDICPGSGRASGPRFRGRSVCRECGQRLSVTASGLVRRHRVTPDGERASEPTGALVYFIGDGVGHVKIGIAFDVAARLSTLQIGNAFELCVFAVETGGAPRERELHIEFAAARVRGEWFRLTPELARYIASKQAIVGLTNPT